MQNQMSTSSDHEYVNMNLSWKTGHCIQPREDRPSIARKDAITQESNKQASATTSKKLSMSIFVQPQKFDFKSFINKEHKAQWLYIRRKNICQM